MLSIAALQAFYGKSQVLFDVSLEVRGGEVVSLLGRNGMGKTTTLKCLFGVLAPAQGRLEFEGISLGGLPAWRIARLGLALVPEGRQVFPNLTVEENLTTTAGNYGGFETAPWTLQRVLSLFPGLEKRRGNMGHQLSGGEQQMLAIGRALMTSPRLLVLDEATEGLAPLVRAEIWRVLAQLKREGQAILVIDKDLNALNALVDRHYVLQKGVVVWQGSSNELRHSGEVQRRFLSM